MSVDTNPFTPPQVDLTQTPSLKRHYGDATKGQRVLNVMLDYVGFLLFSVFIGVLGGLTEATQKAFSALPEQLFGLLVIFFYYVILEATTGRTLGKLITGTKVVRDNGEPPGLLRVMGRTLLRFIPFEAFSFLGSSDRGWHDRGSGTRVVRTRPSKYDRMQQEDWTE